MKKTFKYRLFPSKVQIKTLEQTLRSCRWLYNHFLEQRKNAYEIDQIYIGKYNQINTLPQLKNARGFLNSVHSQVLQNVPTRLDLAFEAFFRRVKLGEEPGYPRFHGKYRYDSFTYPQVGFKIFKKRIRLSKIGSVKAKIHRPVEGKIKTCTIKKSKTNKWYATVSCEVPDIEVKQPLTPAIGIDMGLESFATLSDGDKIENQRFFKKEEKELAKAQRKFFRQPKRSKGRAKARKVVARIHERIRHKREDFSHQESRKIINNYNTIVVEDLSIVEMKEGNFKGLNKSIGDVAWRGFLNKINYKAEWAGKRCIQINPAYTSQACSRCGTRQKLSLSNRQYKCLSCDLSLDRDHNAAINILTLGLQGQG